MALSRRIYDTSFTLHRVSPLYLRRASSSSASTSSTSSALAGFSGVFWEQHAARLWKALDPSSSSSSSRATASATAITDADIAADIAAITPQDISITAVDDDAGRTGTGPGPGPKKAPGPGPLVDCRWTGFTGARQQGMHIVLVYETARFDVFVLQASSSSSSLSSAAAAGAEVVGGVGDEKEADDDDEDEDDGDEDDDDDGAPDAGGRHAKGRGRGRGGGGSFIHLPLLLLPSRLHPTARLTVLEYLTTTFDSRIGSVRRQRLASEAMLGWLDDYLSLTVGDGDNSSASGRVLHALSLPGVGVDVEAGEKNVQVTLAFAAPVAPALKTLEIVLSREDVRRLYSASTSLFAASPAPAPAETETPTGAAGGPGPFTTNFARYLHAHLGLSLPFLPPLRPHQQQHQHPHEQQGQEQRQVLTVSRVSCAAWTLSAVDGRVRFHGVSRRRKPRRERRPRRKREAADDDEDVDDDSSEDEDEEDEDDEGEDDNGDDEDEVAQAWNGRARKRDEARDALLAGLVERVRGGGSGSGSGGGSGGGGGEMGGSKKKGKAKAMMFSLTP
ncbi:MAG: hypothetical protein M1826_001865 [Phylliscum demangeonii]|nr:MAG: hypothetical protein M1826_001865 [Phylliscum demangeonii]